MDTLSQLYNKNSMSWLITVFLWTCVILTMTSQRHKYQEWTPDFTTLSSGSWNFHPNTHCRKQTVDNNNIPKIGTDKYFSTQY